MNQKTKAWIIAACCAVVIFLLSCAGKLIWKEANFSEMPFGYRCSISSVFYATGDLPTVSPENAVFALSDAGRLYDISEGKSKRLTGSVTALNLSEENFDCRFADQDAWRVNGLNAKSARENNAKAWKYTALDGSFYYLLLQNNGDVFLCVGENKAIELFVWLQPLEKY